MKYGGQVREGAANAARNPELDSCCINTVTRIQKSVIFEVNQLKLGFQKREIKKFFRQNWFFRIHSSNLKEFGVKFRLYIWTSKEGFRLGFWCNWLKLSRRRSKFRSLPLPGRRIVTPPSSRWTDYLRCKTQFISWTLPGVCYNCRLSP